MRLLIMLVVAVLGCSSAVPKDNLRHELQFTDETRNARLIDGIINQVMEVVRDLMKNGSDDIPVLDPFTLDAIKLDGDLIGLKDSYVSVENLNMIGVSTFEADELTVSGTGLLRPATVNFDIKVPTINISTEKYDMLINIFGGVVFGKGDSKFQIVNGRVKGFIAMRINVANGRITLTDCKISIGLDSFEPVITGMFDNEASSEFVSAFLKNLIPTMLEVFEEEITDLISAGVMTYGNQILETINIYDIIGG